jgi:hypothetical protein
MTHHRDDRVNALERALLEAYRSQTSSGRDVDVTQTVMREIRRSGVTRSWWAAATGLDQFVWRTATITAAVVLMATLLTVGLLRTPAADSPSLVAEEFESVPLFED